MLDLLDEYEVDLVVLARYMQILTPNVVNVYPDRITNIHHSFLPAFVGADRRAYDRGVKTIGATAHYVTEELDAGPVIPQDTAHITQRDTVEDLVRTGREIERRVELFANAGLFLDRADLISEIAFGAKNPRYRLR